VARNGVGVYSMAQRNTQRIHALGFFLVFIIIYKVLSFNMLFIERSV